MFALCIARGIVVIRHIIRTVIISKLIQVNAINVYHCVNGVLLQVWLEMGPNGACIDVDLGNCVQLSEWMSVSKGSSVAAAAAAGGAGRPSGPSTRSPWEVQSVFQQLFQVHRIVSRARSISTCRGGLLLVFHILKAPVYGMMSYVAHGFNLWTSFPFAVDNFQFGRVRP